MADDEESEEPAVTLGEGREVEGVPLAQVSAKFMWGLERSTIEAREGETTIRTPDGPRELGDVLSETDRTYFATKQEFENTVRSVIGDGPVPTVGDDPEDEGGGEGQPETDDEGAESDESSGETDPSDTGSSETDADEDG